MQIKLVEIMTGVVVEPAHIQGNRFWLQEEMERPGRPKEEARGALIGVHRSGTVACPQWSGEYAVLDRDREEVAEEKRASIGRLDSKIRAIKRELYELYESPQKYEAAMKLTATRTITLEATTLAEAKQMADEAAEASYDDHSEENWTVEGVQIEEVRPRSQ